MTRQQRETIGSQRLLRILRTHAVANLRTLEQKISDAGPSHMRVDPHVLTSAHKHLKEQGQIIVMQHSQTNWSTLPGTDPQVLRQRLETQAAIFRQVSKRDLAMRVGQTLEIATFRALQQTGATFFGRFKNLNEHGDERMYSKEEPPQHLGSYELEGEERLDFILQSPSRTWLGIECKNIREWLYPDRREIKDAIRRCLALNCVPVIIGRRIPYVTFMLLNFCGVIIHQTYNQLYPQSAESIANLARDKFNLGYHDIRLGNAPDQRLLKFITHNLFLVADGQRTKFDECRDLLSEFAHDQITYKEFAGWVLRRQRGMNEGNNFAEGDPADWE